MTSCIIVLVCFQQLVSNEAVNESKVFFFLQFTKALAKSTDYEYRVCFSESFVDVCVEKIGVASGMLRTAVQNKLESRAKEEEEVSNVTDLQSQIQLANGPTLLDTHICSTFLQSKSRKFLIADHIM